MSPRRAESPRLLAVELDGASWSVIEPLLAAGRLPNIRGLMHRGAHGVLRSVEPMMSPVVWTSVWTGKRPDKHGIQDFLSRADVDLRCARLWDIAASRLGWRCGLLDCFLTWPPDPGLPGFVIPDGFALDHRTVPPELSWYHRLCNGRDNAPAARLGQYARLAASGCRWSTVARLLRLQARGRLPPDGSKRLSLDKLLMFRCELPSEFFLRLLREHRPELAVIHLHAVDTAQHYFWKERAAVDRAYEACDAALGRLLSRAGPDAWVTVLSDHGAKSAEGLQECVISLEAVLRRLGWENRGTSFFNFRAETPETHLYSPDRDWLSRLSKLFETARWSPGAGPVFRVEGPAPGSHRMILRYEPLPEGPARAERQVEMGGRLLPAEEVFVRAPMTGMHHPDGIWILSGPGVRRGLRFETASVCDVTPTLLGLLGLPAARDMDGQARRDLLEPSASSPTPPDPVDSYGPAGPMGTQAAADASDSMADVRQRLRSMGYLE